VSMPAASPPRPALSLVARRKLPWYAVLYRLLGAQGTFVLWIVSIIALWWTASPTWQRMANRTPTTGRSPSSLGNMASTDTTRWAETTGVLVRLDRNLLLSASVRPPALPPMPLLFDPADPAATWWTETAALAERVGDSEKKDPEAFNELSKRRSRLVEESQQLLPAPSSLLPAPSSALLIQDADPPTLSPPPPTRREAGNPLNQYIQDILDWAALVRERVHPGEVVKGVLVETPHTVAARLKGELGAEVAPMLLQRDRQPRDTESYVFAGALIALLFLAAGFYAETRVPVEDRPPPAPAV
jgi:hypothetical protein